ASLLHLLRPMVRCDHGPAFTQRHCLCCPRRRDLRRHRKRPRPHSRGKPPMNPMKTLALLLLLVCCTVPARTESGTLTPRDKEAPDPSILSLDEMRVDIAI